MRPIILITLFTIGCANVSAAAKQKSSVGDFDGAIKIYDNISAGKLTRGEHKDVNKARREVFEAKSRLEFKVLKKSAVSAKEKRRALIDIYSQVVSETYATPLRKEIEAQSLAWAKDEITAIHELLRHAKVGEALRESEVLFLTIIESDPAIEQLIEIRLHAAGVLKALAKTERSPGVKSLLIAVAARCERDAVFPAESFSNPLFALQSRVKGVEFENPGVGPKVEMTGNYSTQANVQTLSESFSFQEYEKRTFQKKVCTKSTTYVKSTSKYPSFTVSFNKGVESYTHYMVTRTVSRPVSNTTCKNVPYVATVAVEKSATRKYQTRKIVLSATLDASIAFREGTVSLPVRIEIEDEVRELSTSKRYVMKFYESESQQIQRLIKRLEEAIQEKAKETLKTLLQNHEKMVASQEADPIKRRDANARLVLYGGEVPASLSDLQFMQNKKLRWLDPFDIPFATISDIRFNRLYGTAAWRFDMGFDSPKIVLGSRYVQMTDLSVQPDREAFGLEFGFRMPYLSALTNDKYDPFGWVLRDEYSVAFTLGARTSTAYQYPIRVKDSEEDGFYYSGDVYAQVLVGYRLRSLGLMGGIRPRAMFHEIGDAGSASVGVPLIARLELNLSDHYPVVIHAWGYSPFADTDAQGIEIQVAVGEEWNLSGKAHFLNAETRVGGIKDIDIIDLNRRKNLIIGVSFEYVPDLRSW